MRQYPGIVLGQVVVIDTGAHARGGDGLIVGGVGQHPVVTHVGHRQLTRVVESHRHLLASGRHAHLFEVVLHGVIAFDDQCALIGQHRGCQ
ncbi:hypothetical protein D3C86_1993170 [compost metagenome]